MPPTTPPPHTHTHTHTNTHTNTYTTRIKFTKNVTFLQVFSCILLVQFIYLVSPEVETLPKLIPAGTKSQNIKQQFQLAIN